MPQDVKSSRSKLKMVKCSVAQFDLPTEIEGIRIPDPVSSVEFPDDSFQKDYADYLAFWGGNPRWMRESHPAISPAQYAESMRRVQIPKRRYTEQWEKRYGKMIGDQEIGEKGMAASANVEKILLQRAMNEGADIGRETQASGAPKEAAG